MPLPKNFTLSMPEPVADKLGAMPDAEQPMIKTSPSALPSNFEVTIPNASANVQDIPLGNMYAKQIDLTHPFKKVLFDYLQRGQFTTANMTKALMAGKSGNDILKAGWDGMTGKEKGDFVDIAEQNKIPMPVVIGTLLNIGGDPTTYLPTGALTGALKVAKQLGEKAPYYDKLKKAVVNSHFVDMLGEAFIPGYKLPEKYYETKKVAQDLLNFEEKTIIEKIGKQAKGLVEEDRKVLSYIRQHPDEFDKLPRLYKTKLKLVAKEFEKLGQDAVERGWITQKSFDQLKDTYLEGYYTFSRPLSGKIPPTMFERIKKPLFTKQKEFKTLQEAKEYFVGKGRADLGPEEDIFKILGVRKIEHTRTIARDKFINDTMEMFGTKTKNLTKAQIATLPEGQGIFLPKGSLKFFHGEAGLPKSLLKQLDDQTVREVNEIMEVAPEFVQKYVGVSTKVPMYMMPKEIVRDMNKISTSFVNDKATNSLLGYFDKLQGAWKGMATAIRLPFHLRNMYSNWYQAWLSGVSPVDFPKLIGESARIQAGAEGFTTIGKKAVANKQLQQLATKYGVRGRGWMGADIPENTMRILEDTLNPSLVKKLSPMELGRKFGTAVEDNGRMMVFIDRLRKGDTPEQAAKTVKKYLFDYSELTPFEQNVMKRAIPFYTWQRKNIPLQIESLFQQPAKFAAIGKIQSGLEAAGQETPEENKLKPDYFKEMMYIKTPFKDKTGRPLYAHLDLPYNDLLINTKDLFSSLTPAKIIPELLMNTKSFPELGGKIERFPGEMVTAPFYMLWLPEQVQKLFGMNQIMDRWSGEKVMGVRAKWRYAIESIFPFLSELRKTNPAPVPMEEDEKWARRLSYTTGIKFTPLDLQMQQYRTAMEQRKRSTELSQKLSQQLGRAHTEEEMKHLMEPARKFE